MKLPIFSPENRSTYRVPIQDGQGTLWVGLKSGPVKVRLDDVSSRGLGFTLSAADAEGLKEGDELILRIKIGDDQSPQLFIRSQIRGIREEDGASHIGAFFKDHDRLYQQLTPSQWRFLNRRGAFRVPPADHRGDPLYATFHGSDPDESSRHVVNDLSSSGLAIRLSGRDEYNFPSNMGVQAQFELPGAPDPFDLRLNLVHRSFVAGVERIGFAIDMERTRRAEDQTEAIVRYVMGRQSELLRQ